MESWPPSGKFLLGLPAVQGKASRKTSPDELFLTGKKKKKSRGLLRVPVSCSCPFLHIASQPSPRSSHRQGLTLSPHSTAQPSTSPTQSLIAPGNWGAIDSGPPPGAASTALLHSASPLSSDLVPSGILAMRNAGFVFQK